MTPWRELAAAAGAGLEAVALALAVHDRGELGALTLLAHVGGCSGIAVGLERRLPLGATARRLAFASSFFLPVCGALGWIAAALAMPAAEGRRAAALVRTPVPGPESARVLRGTPLAPSVAQPASDRVAAARASDDPAAIALLRRMIAHPDEDVRLLAHAVLTSKLRAAHRDLHERARELESAPAPLRAAIHRHLAAGHWELARTGLADGGCLAEALERAGRHARAALAEHPARAALWLLLGRIELRRERVDEAETALSRALELGLPRAVVEPYLVEAAFLDRRFDRVRQLLAAAEPDGANAALDRIPELLVVTWSFARPPREPVDVALLVEGTYPFVRGGVSSWAHRLIESLPETTFSVVFLGGRRSDHGPPAYPALPNVRHLEREYLFEPPAREPRFSPAGRRPGRCPFADIDRLHELLRSTGPGSPLDPTLLGELARVLAEPRGLTRRDFLQSDEAWDRISRGYRRDCPDASFTDYFWTVRACHAAVFTVAELARRLPPARSYHALSTGYAGFLGAVLRHRHGRPLVVTEHGIYTKERKIDLASAERVPGDGGDPLASGTGRRLWMRLFEGLGRITYASADRIIALHEGGRGRQIQDGADARRTRVIPNGVDLGRFAAARAARPTAPPPVLGFVGRVVPIKDVKCFIRAVKVAATRHPGIRGRVVGPTEEDASYARECVELAADLGLEDRLTFTGYRPAEAVLPELGLLVLTSVSEGLPLVVLEAFASGLPVVTTDAGACRELVEGRTPDDRALGVAGAVLPPFADPEAIARTALDLIMNPPRWRAARQAGLRRVELYYREAAVFEAYGHIYREARGWPA